MARQAQIYADKGAVSTRGRLEMRSTGKSDGLRREAPDRLKPRVSLRALGKIKNEARALKARQKRSQGTQAPNVQQDHDSDCRPHFLRAFSANRFFHGIPRSRGLSLGYILLTASRLYYATLFFSRFAPQNVTTPIRPFRRYANTPSSA
jgi:hypothetical protein